MNEIEKLIEMVKDGDLAATEGLLPAAYRELRQIAGSLMSSEASGNTLQPTALVHEAYLRMMDRNGEGGKWNSPGHFFSAATEAMRRVLIDSARRKLAKKRGAGAEHTAWDDSKVGAEQPPEELVALDEALSRLEEVEPRLADVVRLRYFGGMTVPETAAALKSSPRSVNRQWETARAWLFREIEESR